MEPHARCHLRDGFSRQRSVTRGVDPTAEHVTARSDAERAEEASNELRRRHGFRRTVSYVVGTALGIALLVLFAGAGIGVLIEAVPASDIVLKVVGSSYLLYVASLVLRGGAVGRTEVTHPPTLRQAIAFQCVNPKAWIFAVAAVGSFLPPALSRPVGIALVAGILIPVVVGSSSMWAAGGSWHRSRSSGCSRPGRSRTEGAGRPVPAFNGSRSIWLSPTRTEKAVSPRRVPIDDPNRDPLPGLRDQLTKVYGDAVPRETIDEVAGHAVDQLANARIRDFVPVFAWRHACEHLRRAS